MESRNQPTPATPRTPEPSPDAKRREEELAAREAAHQQSVEALAAPEQPTPTQEEADAMKEHAIEGGTPAGAPAAGETEAQRKERTEREAREQQQRRERDQRPDPARSGYQTR